MQDTLSDTLQIIRDNFRGILSRFHYLPVVSNLDQCAPSRLKLDELFAQKQPYNIKSATCQIQASTSRALHRSFDPSVRIPTSRKDGV